MIQTLHNLGETTVVALVASVLMLVWGVIADDRECRIAGKITLGLSLLSVVILVIAWIWIG